MVRTLKPAPIRKREILDAALTLFMSRGYDAVSVNDILAATGLSKGAFYHHYSSKTEVLQAVVERLSEDSVSQAEVLLAAAPNDAVSRLNTFFGAGSQYKLANVERLRGLIEVLSREDNVRLRLACQQHIVEAIVPILARVLHEATLAGELSVEAPSETARVLLHLGQLVNDAFAAGMRMSDRQQAVVLCQTRIRTTERAIEVLLGLSAGSFRIVSPDLIAAFFTPGEQEVPT